MADAASPAETEGNNPLEDEWISTLGLVATRYSYTDIAKAIHAPVEGLRTAGLGLTRIETDGRYFVQAEAGGKLAITVPCWDGDYLADIIAFRLDDPEVWFVRTGYGKALGLDAADAVRAATPIWRLPSDPPPPALRLFRTPLSWMQAGSFGTCVLNPAWFSYCLSGVKAVVPEDAPHRDTILEMRRRQANDFPKVVVPNEVCEAA